MKIRVVAIDRERYALLSQACSKSIVKLAVCMEGADCHTWIKALDILSVMTWVSQWSSRIDTYTLSSECMAIFQFSIC